MSDTSQIKALLSLLDDPDTEVYDSVATQLITYGKDIIPKLENIWEATDNEEVQHRIEWLIHRVHFEKLQKDVYDWCHEPSPSLIRGGILVAQYAYPDFDVQQLNRELDKMRKNIWLELNNYLTPLEQVNIFNSILYNYFKLQGHELTERKPELFFINNVVENKQGNAHSIGLLYLALCEMLDVPIFAVDIPRQFILAYIDALHHFYPGAEDYPIHHIQFFVDPLNGMVYTKSDVEAYLRKLNISQDEHFYLPLKPTRIIYKYLEALYTCYGFLREEEKAAEIKTLLNIIAGVEE